LAGLRRARRFGYRSGMIPSLSDDPPLTPHARHLRLPGTRNLRDIGGYPAGPGRRTRWRTLLRTDQLNLLPRASQQVLLDHGLRCVIDLRWPRELEEAPSVFAASPQVRYVSLPLTEDGDDVGRGLLRWYHDMLDRRAHTIAAVARTLLERDGLPAVVGCAGGKDRTGVTIALLLAAVGVPDDIIVADYALSSQAFVNARRDPHLDDWRATPIQLESPPAYMEATLAHLQRRHGGARGLLMRSGLGRADVDSLVDRLTEPAAD
jgi:protein-tyrosine phosphatase